MRILQVTPQFHPQVGGVERHVEGLSQSLVAAGHDVLVVTMVPSGGAAAQEEVNGVEVVRLPSAGIGPHYRISLQSISYFRRESLSFQIVHVHNYHGSLLPVVAFAVSTNLVMTPHFNDRPHSTTAAALHRFYAPIGRAAMLKADAVICDSEAERTRVTTQLHVPEQRTTVIPSGVAALSAQVIPRETKNPNLLLTVGRLVAYKRQERIIDALSELPPEYALAIVGDGPRRSELEQHAMAHGLADRVTFTGNVSEEELRRWYWRAGTVATASSAEAFGLTIIEALSARCRVVCSDIPAFRDLALRFPDHVRVVANADPGQFAQAVQEAASRAPAPPDLTPFSWSQISRQHVEVYEQVLHTR